MAIDPVTSPSDSMQSKSEADPAPDFMQLMVQRQLYEQMFEMLDEDDEGEEDE